MRWTTPPAAITKEIYGANAINWEFFVICGMLSCSNFLDLRWNSEIHENWPSPSLHVRTPKSATKDEKRINWYKPNSNSEITDLAIPYSEYVKPQRRLTNDGTWEPRRNARWWRTDKNGWINCRLQTHESSTPSRTGTDKEIKFECKNYKSHLRQQ